MWNGLLRSLGKGARATAKSMKAQSGTAKTAIAIGQLALPAKCFGGTSSRSLSNVVKAGTVAALVAPRVGRTAAQVLGSASASFRKRALIVGAGTYASLRALRRILSIGGRSSSSLRAAAEQAEKIVQLLNEKDIAPDRIGIDGLPGSGKSTLARALADKLDMKWASLDQKNLHLPENLGQRPVAPGCDVILNLARVDFAQVPERNPFLACVELYVRNPLQAGLGDGIAEEKPLHGTLLGNRGLYNLLSVGRLDRRCSVVR